MNEQIKAGSDIHAGDGGYGIGTKENYDAFVKVRNKSLAAARIKELVRQAVESVDIVTGNEALDDELAKMYIPDCFSEKFAELIVRECMRMCDVAAVGYETHGHTKEANGCYSAKEYIEEHFGLEGMSTEDKKTLIKELLGVKND